MSDSNCPDFIELTFSEVPFADLTETGLKRDARMGGLKIGQDIDFRNLKISIGNRPISWRLPNFFEQANKILPQDMRLYEDWDVWMIAHAVSVADRGEFATVLNGVVDAVGYEAEFDPAMAATVGLLPEPSVVRNVGGSFEVIANLGLNGSVAASDEVEKTNDGLPLSGTGGAKLKFSSSTEFVGRLNFGVWTPKVVTTGLCSSRCEWLFNRINAPLRNSQIMFQTVLVPAGVDELKFRCRAYALIRSVGFIPIPSRFETTWREIRTKPIAKF